LTAAGLPWRVECQRGPAQDLHADSARLVGEKLPAGRTARVLQSDQPALVLGSSQPVSDVDAGAAEAAGVEVVRRRSGGGAVLVDPEAVIWVDLVLPAGDPLWDADVHRASWWVGEAWAAAVDGVGAGPARVWRSAMQTSPWSGRVCFAGIGPGEVLLGDQKVVGVAQRRTRHGALFQTAALLRWDVVPLLGLLRLDDAARARGTEELEPAAVGLGPDRAEALLAHLISVLRYV
jgi:lipoate---protein ligase